MNKTYIIKEKCPFNHINTVEQQAEVKNVYHRLEDGKLVTFCDNCNDTSCFLESELNN